MPLELLTPTIESKSRDKFQKYIELHESIINKNENETKRITFCVTCGAGYGNKVYTLISSLVIAILTDTAFIIEWPQAQKYFNPSLYKSLSKNYHINQLNYAHSTNLIIEAMSKNDWEYEKKISELINKNLPFGHDRYQYGDCRALFFTLCANSNYFKKFLDYDLVNADIIEKANEALQVNNNLTESEKIDRLYSVGFEVGSNLMNKVWLLETNFKNYINKFYDENFKNFYVIGMQFRFEYIDDKDVFKFIDCANYLVELNSVSRSVKWFITADKERVFDILKNNSGILIKGEGLLGHIFYDNENSYSRSIMDNELLARSDEMIISGGSTFGFVSAMRKHLLPYYVEGRREKDIGSDKPCRRMTFNRGPRTYHGISLI
ncbi:unnamed protein product [Brachionus calyciflorus]|uniref:Uncharacterized protein n=1 Tax=Brachionus calyciflorus TaxID=104777 RepID=A0A814D891_9BILA|nr:unnamed protein product [Brachionus calyciflorus]